MKKLLVTVSKVEMKEIYTKQKQKEPSPLTAQFIDRLSREDAIKRQNERWQKTVQLIPAGTVKHHTPPPISRASELVTTCKSL